MSFPSICTSKDVLRPQPTSSEACLVCCNRTPGENGRSLKDVFLMLRYLHGGFVAAQHQLAMVVLITFFSLLAIQFLTDESGVTLAGGGASFWDRTSPFLTWAYVLTAVGLAATTGEHINESADVMERAAGLGKLGESKQVLQALAAQLGLSSLACALVALRGPPEPFIELVKHLGYPGAASTIWAALMSIA